MKFHLTVSENGSDRVFVDRDFDCLFGIVSVGDNHFLSLNQGCCTNGVKLCGLNALVDLALDICKDMIDEDPVVKFLIDELFGSNGDSFIKRVVVKEYNENLEKPSSQG